MQHTAAASTACYQIRFPALEGQANGLAFRCDDRGNVELDSLSDKARAEYLFARALVGRNFARPAIVRVPPSDGLRLRAAEAGGGRHAALR